MNNKQLFNLSIVAMLVSLFVPPFYEFQGTNVDPLKVTLRHLVSLVMSGVFIGAFFLFTNMWKKEKVISDILLAQVTYWGVVFVAYIVFDEMCKSNDFPYIQYIFSPFKD